MEELIKKLQQFNASIKTIKPKLPKVANPASVKGTGIAPDSKKDPVKAAEQIKNPDIKPLAIDAAKIKKETFKLSKNGQWSIEKKNEDLDKGLKEWALAGAIGVGAMTPGTSSAKQPELSPKVNHERVDRSQITDRQYGPYKVTTFVHPHAPGISGQTANNEITYDGSGHHEGWAKKAAKELGFGFKPNDFMSMDKDSVHVHSDNKTIKN